MTLDFRDDLDPYLEDATGEEDGDRVHKTRRRIRAEMRSWEFVIKPNRIRIACIRGHVDFWKDRKKVRAKFLEKNTRIDPEVKRTRTLEGKSTSTPEEIREARAETLRELMIDWDLLGPHLIGLAEAMGTRPGRYQMLHEYDPRYRDDDPDVVAYFRKLKETESEAETELIEGRIPGEPDNG